MTDLERELYRLALERGAKRFESECLHLTVKNGYCVNCLRRVK